MWYSDDVMKTQTTESTETVIIIDYPQHGRSAYFVGDNQPQELTVTFDKAEATTYPDMSASLKECSRLQEAAKGRRVEVVFCTCYKSHASLTY